MTTRQAGERLGVALRTVQLWVESGTLPAWRTAGGHRRIARTAVDALMRERASMLVPAETPPTPVTPHSKTAKRIKLLVVEDDPTLLRLTTQVMATWKLPIVLSTASNGFDALVRIGEVQPDMLVTDLNMPGIDGFQMLRALKMAGSGYESLRVVVVSALDSREIAARGGLPGDVRFFPKPVHYGRLESLVRSFFDTATEGGNDEDVRCK